METGGTALCGERRCPRVRRNHDGTRHLLRASNEPFTLTSSLNLGYPASSFPSFSPPSTEGEAGLGGVRSLVCIYPEALEVKHGGWAEGGPAQGPCSLSDQVRPITQEALLRDLGTWSSSVWRGAC